LTEERGVGLKGWLSGPGRKNPKADPVSPAALSRYRVAVLPLSNISPDPQDEYFADGMTEEVISKVSRIEGLEVISRTSVMQYKKTPKPVREVGRELDVGTVLEGSVRKAGNKLRISIKMIHAEKDRPIWSEDYDRNLQDVFAIQSEIAKQIAEALQVRLLPDNKKRLEKSPTSNVDAYTLYLKARPSIGRNDKEAYDLAIGLYEQAVAKDPNFALAYAGLARSYSGLAFHGYLPSKIAGAKARTYASKALEIHDCLAEAHRVMGGILRNFDWDIAGAEREFKRAIELNPSLADAHSSLGLLLMFKREAEAAISEAKRAIELDPLSVDTLGGAGTVYLYLGMNDDAIEQFSKALSIDPENNYARNNLGLSQVRKGMLGKGIKEMEKIKAGKGRAPNMGSDLAYAYAQARRISDVQKLLSEWLNEVETNHELAIAIASAYASLGD